MKIKTEKEARRHIEFCLVNRSKGRADAITAADISWSLETDREGSGREFKVLVGRASNGDSLREEVR